MSGQTLHPDYYPLSLIQVGLHNALVRMFAILFFKFSLVLKFYYQVNTIYIMSDYNFDGLF